MVKWHIKGGKEKLFLVVILGVSLFLNLYRLEDLPLAFHNDEASHGLEAAKIISGENPLLGLSDYYKLPLSSVLHHSLAILLAGQSIFALRASSAIVGSFSLMAFYYLAKMLIGKNKALLSTFLLSTSHFWIALSRIGINYNLTVLFELFAFIFLIKIIREGRIRDGLLLGIFTASSFYLYFSARILPIIVFVSFLFYIIKRRSIDKLKLFFALLVAFALAASPMLVVYARDLEGFNSRVNNVFVFSEEVKPWLRDVYKTDSKLKVLGLQIERTLNMSEENCESSGQYGYCGRMFNIPTLFFFLTGIFLSLARIKHIQSFFLLCWFWLVIIFGSFLTIPPLFMPRILGALPVVYIFFSVGFYYLRSLLGKVSNAVDVLFAIVVVFILVSNLKIYFVDYPKEIWGDHNKYRATIIAKAIKEHGNFTSVFLTGPSLHADFSTLEYIAPGSERVEISNPASYQFDSDVRRVIYIFYPRYYEKFIEAKELYSSSEVIEVKFPPESQPSAYMLRVD